MTFEHESCFHVFYILMFLDQLKWETNEITWEVQVLHPGWWQVRASRGEASQEDHGRPATLNDGDTSRRLVVWWFNHPLVTHL